MSVRLVVAVVAVLLVASGVIGANGIVKVWQTQRELDALERDLAQLRTRTAELARTVERLRSDPQYMEKLAREDLGYVRHGETVLKFPSQPPAK